MLEVDQAKRLKELQKENGRLKRMLADELLGKELLKEELEKKVMSPGVGPENSRTLIALQLR